MVTTRQSTLRWPLLLLSLPPSPSPSPCSAPRDPHIEDTCSQARLPACFRDTLVRGREDVCCPAYPFSRKPLPLSSCSLAGRGCLHPRAPRVAPRLRHRAGSTERPDQGLANFFYDGPEGKHGRPDEPQSPQPPIVAQRQPQTTDTTDRAMMLSFQPCTNKPLRDMDIRIS